ncbi:MAG: hypothetical protein AAF357_04455 [Verrucomicrobiota bacterium]
MNREPVNPDDPAITAYALGEMSFSERLEFEARLESSPTAQADLESMDEVMSLLSKGLKNEWASQDCQPNLEVLPAVEADEVVVPFSRQTRRPVFASVTAIAAAVAIALVSVAAFKASDAGPASGAIASAEVSPESWGKRISDTGLQVPQLVLADEVDNLGSLDLVGNLNDLFERSAPINASYLSDDSEMMLNGNATGASKGHFVPASFSPGSEKTRVDSYLPPVELRSDAGRDHKVGARVKTFYPATVDQAAGDELKLVADFQSVQNALEEVVATLPESALRQRLQPLVERNGRAVVNLKREFAQ